ncbi:hypothetical protein BT69DRAFT_1283510 [Atractiella rhizophila]|nr:hypothetical protein BT69DRAFT_1283510 [Atractiella rhizophila]
MGDAAIFETYLQLLDSIRTSLLFPLLPEWAIIEAKVTIGVLGFSIVVWILELYIRWKKGTLWLYRWEGDGYFRPNVHLFIPIQIVIFSALYIVYLVGTIERNVPNAERDWRPYFALFQGVFTVPLFLIAALWTWNSILSSSYARKTMPIQQRDGHYNQNHDGENVTFWRRLNLKPKIVHFFVGLVIVTMLSCITIFAILSAIHRERAIVDFQTLNNILRAAIAGESVDLAVVGRVQAHLQKEAGASLLNYKRLTATQTATLLLFTIPYIYSVLRLFLVLFSQKSHFKRAIERLYALEAYDLQESLPHPTIVPLHPSQMAPNDGSTTSEASSDFAGLARPATKLVLAHKMRKEARDVKFDKITNAQLARQQKETVERMQSWRRSYRLLLYIHCLSILVYTGFKFIVANAIAVSGGSTLNQKLSTFVSTHLPVYCFAAPELVGCLYLLYDAIRLPPSSPSSISHPSRSLSNANARMEGLPASGGTIELGRTRMGRADHGDDVEGSGGDRDGAIRISWAQSERTDEAFTVEGNGDGRFGWSEKQRPSNWVQEG